MWTFENIAINFTTPILFLLSFLVWSLVTMDGSKHPIKQTFLFMSIPILASLVIIIILGARSTNKDNIFSIILNSVYIFIDIVFATLLIVKFKNLN